MTSSIAIVMLGMMVLEAIVSGVFFQYRKTNPFCAFGWTLLKPRPGPSKLISLFFSLGLSVVLGKMFGASGTILATGSVLSTVAMYYLWYCGILAIAEKAQDKWEVSKPKVQAFFGKIGPLKNVIEMKRLRDQPDVCSNRAA